MGGLYKLFLKITPIIMLICFICFGITHTFQQEGAQPITYLSTEQVQYVVYTRNPNTQEIVTETKTQTIYTFDMQSYAQNLNQNILKRAVTNVIDIETYTQVLNVFKDIWDDGWDPGDGFQTVINTVILVIDTILMPINILLVPLRIISGILLTGFSLVGINVSRQTAIITALNAVLDQARIQLLAPTFENVNNRYNGTTWQWDTTINNQAQTNTWDVVDVNFTTQGGGVYIQFISAKQNGVTYMYYVDRDNYQIVVYDSSNGGWQYAVSQTIHISIDNHLTDINFQKLELYLTNWATAV